MKQLILILSGLIILNSCEKNDATQKNVENKKPDTLAIDRNQQNQIAEAENVDYCYMNVLAKDSVFFSYKIIGGKVSGKLKYKNFEKDSNSGLITGKVSGDTMKVNYKFTSEGSTSEREIYFLQDSGVLLEGIGKYAESNSSKSVYESPKAINFTKGQRLTPADCNMIANKLK
jgi:hypothetical protein